MNASWVEQMTQAAKNVCQPIETAHLDHLAPLPRKPKKVPGFSPTKVKVVKVKDTSNVEVEPPARTPEWVRYWIPRIQQAEEKKIELADYLHEMQLKLLRGFVKWCDDEVGYSYSRVKQLIAFSIEQEDSQQDNDYPNENKPKENPALPAAASTNENEEEKGRAQVEQKPKRKASGCISMGYKEIKNKRPSSDFKDEPELWEWIDSEARDYDMPVGKIIVEMLKELKAIKDSLA